MNCLLKKIKNRILFGITGLAGLGAFLSLGIDYDMSDLRITIPIVLACWGWLGLFYSVNKDYFERKDEEHGEM